MKHKYIKVAILIPYVRPKKLERCIPLAIDNAGIDPNDFEIVSLEDTELIGCPKMLSKLVSVTHSKYVAFIGDDCMPHKNWLKNALIDMHSLPDCWGLVGLNDLTRRTLACHWLASRKLLNSVLEGEFFHTGYRHCYCDNELTERCEEAGRYKYSSASIVEHDHPLITKGPSDKFYQKAYLKKNVEHDRDLYFKRKTNGWRD